MQLRTSPLPWNSLFDPDGINYIFDYESIEITGVSSASGYLKFTIDSGFTEATLAVGDTLYVPATEIDVYPGFHTVREIVSSTQIVTDTEWTGESVTLESGASLRWVRLPEIKLYAGALEGEEWEEDLPLTLLATFTPRNHPVENAIVINVAGWLRTAFQNTVLAPPELSEDELPDFNAFNKFRLYFDGDYDDDYFVALSTLPSLELNEDYVGTGRWLNESSPAIMFTCGPTLLQRVRASGIYTVAFFDGDVPDGLGEIETGVDDPET